MQCSIHTVRFLTDDPDGFISELRSAAVRHGVRIVLLNADKVAGRRHVEAALRHAARNEAADDLIARTFEMEVLLFAAATRQVGEAVRFGVHRGENRAYLCICPPAGDMPPFLSGMFKQVTGEDWETIGEGKRSALLARYAITPAELALVGEGRLVDLILERVALLSVNR